MATTPEAYVHLSIDGKTLTFYYDTLRADRDGETWKVRDMIFSFNEFFFCPAWTSDHGSLNTTVLTAVFDASFRDFRPTTTERWFYEFNLLERIEGLEHLNTSQVTDMSGMFSGCKSLTALDLSRFDTSKVTGMGRMFSGCGSLTALDLSRFDTSQVTDMGCMFSGCGSLIALDLSRFDTSQVTDMGCMFSGCGSLTTIYCNSSWSARHSDDMFSGCNSLRAAGDVASIFGEAYDVSRANPETGYFTKNVLPQEDGTYVQLSADKKTLTFYFNRERNIRRCCEWLPSEVASKEEITQIVIDESYQNVVPKTTASWFEGFSAVTEIRGLDNLNTSEVTDMSRMFAGCSALRSLDVSSFDTSQVTDMSRMFDTCRSLTSLDLSNFDTSKVTEMKKMFFRCRSLTSLDLTSFDTSKVTGMGWMFFGCGSLTTLDLSRFDTSKVTGMSCMLNSCGSLTTLDLSRFDTSQVEDMSHMFSGCGSLTALDLSRFDTSEVSNMSSMFFRCESLTSLDLTSFDTSKVTDMKEMFSWCVSLTSLDLSRFDTSQVTDMGCMFSGCESLASLDLSRFDTPQVTDMSRMFSGCGSLTSLDLSRFDTSKVTDMSRMFSGCGSLTTIYCNSSWSARHSDDMFSGCNSLRAAGDVASIFGEAYDVSRANPETGYFTKNVLPQEDGTYVQLSADKKTLTFYFDRERNVRRCCAWLPSEVTSKDEITQIVIDESYRNFVPKTTASWFEGFSALTEIRGLDNLNTSEVTNMNRMFARCSALRSLDVSSFDTSQVTDMSRMFWDCQSLTSLDLTSFDTSKVTDMEAMFNDCGSLTSLDLTSFDTSKVTGMGRMFSGCGSLTSLDLTSFDTSQGPDISWMFRDCQSLTTIYCNSLWSGWELDDMFSGCHSLRAAATNVGQGFDISMTNSEMGYFTKKVLSQEDEAYVHLSTDKKTLTFYFDRERNVRMRCCAWDIETTIRQNHQMTPTWLSSEVVSKDEITQIVIDESFRNVVPKTTVSWFEGLSAVMEIRGLDNLNTSEVTDMSRMFAGCSALRSLEVSRFDTSKVTDMSSMFSGCASLTELDLYFFDTAKVTDMHEMFNGCKGLTALDLRSFNTSQVTNMSELFADCSALVDIDISRFDTAQVTDIHAMFKDCKSLTTLDLSNFQTSEVKNMSDMFSGCSALTTIWSFAFRNCFVSDAMFYKCTSLQGAVNFNEKYTDARMANPERGYFSKR